MAKATPRTTEHMLEEVLQRLSTIEARLPVTLNGSRDSLDEAVLHAIAVSTAGFAFTSRELVTHAAQADQVLRQALRDASCESARELGWLLRRVCGDPPHGMCVERLDDDGRDGIVWRVTASFAGFSEKTRTAG